MPKESLKDKLDGNELDLSMSELSVVPVKEMAALPKATHIDLSCNLLTSLPEAFCKLTHIVQLDLSKNKLQELPEDFGGLSRLQHLDLLGNNLRTVPVSFCHLRSLKWMDLKNNPLDEQLKKVTGDCLDDNQCRACATRVVSYMKDVASHIERERQRKLKEEREREAAEKAKEEEEKRKKKAEKMAEKERRRQEHEARRALLRQQKQEANHAEVKEEKVANGTTERKATKQAKGLSCCGVFLAMLVGLVAVLVGLYFYCDNYRKDEACIQARAYLEHLTHKAQDLVAQYLH